MSVPVAPSKEDPYPKLVRDKIPDRIRSQGGIPKVRRLRGNELIDALFAKLLAEVREAQGERTRGGCVSELADVQEVINKLLNVLHTSPDRLQQLMQEKRNDRGGFNDGCYIESVELPAK